METHYIHPFTPVPVPRKLLATGKETDTVMVINKFFGEVLVSALNPVHISEKQLQRSEETTLNPLQPMAKNLHRKKRTTFQIHFPNLTKKWLKERCSFSSHSSKWVLWPLCYEGGLPGLALSPLNIIPEFSQNKFHQIHPILPLLTQMLLRTPQFVPLKHSYKYVATSSY